MFVGVYFHERIWILWHLLDHVPQAGRTLPPWLTLVASQNAQRMCSRTRGLSLDVGSLGHDAGRRQHMGGNVFLVGGNLVQVAILVGHVPHGISVVLHHLISLIMIFKLESVQNPFHSPEKICPIHVSRSAIHVMPSPLHFPWCGSQNCFSKGCLVLGLWGRRYC